MITNYVLVAIRSLVKDRFHAAINVIGLAIGIASVILASLFIQHEIGFDTQHQHGDRLYRVIRETKTESGDRSFDVQTSGAAAELLRNELPEVETTVRTMLRTTWAQHEETILQRNILVADKHILDVFDFPLAVGDKSALDQPRTIFLTRKAARDFFDDENPLGKRVRIEGSYITEDYTVGGILEDIPTQSTLQFDILSTYIIPRYERWWNGWAFNTWRPSNTFVLLKHNTSAEHLGEKIDAMMDRLPFPPEFKNFTYRLQPFGEMYLRSRTDFGLQDVLLIEGLVEYGDIAHVYAAAATSIFVLLIGCINFTNLSTARSANRAREVGLRKVVGATRRQLLFQFLTESWALGLMSLVVGISMVSIALPYFNDYTGRHLTLHYDTTAIASLLSLTLVVGLVAGTYPALFLSRFRPLDVLKGTLAAGATGGSLRKALVVIQFSASVALIVIAIVTHQQMRYVFQKDLGFDKEQVIETRLLWEYRGTSLRDVQDPRWSRYNQIKNAFMEHPNITAATTSRFQHGRAAPHGQFNAYKEGLTSVQMRKNEVDEDFLDFFGIELVAGRDLSDDAAIRWRSESYLPGGSNPLSGDLPPGEAEYLINETAARMLGWDDPVGKRFGPVGARPGVIVGVFKDFHTRTLHEPMEPTVLYAYDWVFKTTYLKVSPHDFDDTLAHMKAVWERYLPIRPFSFAFLDETLNREYLQERQLERTMTVFAGLAIFVGCIGLMGLVSYLAEQRAKEVGIRKVVGASVADIVRMFMRESVVLVAAACLVAWPIAYWAVSGWLEDFAYRIDLTWLPFALGGACMVGLTVLTTVYQVVRAARRNPSDTLRQE